MQDASPHQLFDALGGLAVVEAGHVTEERKVESPADDRGQRHEMPAATAELLEARGDDSLNPLGQGQRGLAGRCGAFMEGSHSLDHHERIPLAGVPDLLVEPSGSHGPERGLGQ